MKRSLSRLAAIAPLALLASGTAQVLAAPQVPPSDEAPSFPAEVELVTVDVVVVDADGNPVTGLTRDDFTVLEDGAPQLTSSFEAVELLPPAPPSQAADAPTTPRPRVSRNDDEGDSGRIFVVAFDDVNLTAFSAHRAKGAAAEFLERGVREGDRVMLASTSGDVWWSERMPEGREALTQMLKRLEGRQVEDLSPERITPWEAMQIELYRNRDVAFRVTRRLEKYNAMPAGLTPRPMQRDALDHPLLLSRAREVYLGAASRTRLTLEALDRVLVSLAPAKGRKAVVLISDGFIYDTSLDGLKRVVESAQRSNVVVYFVDARGLDGMPVEMTAQFGLAPEARDMGINAMGGEYLGAAAFLEGDLSSEGTQNIALESGGFTVKNTNDLAAGIDRVARESEAYYLIGYYPKNRSRDGSFREIRVEVERAGVEVRARRGYYAPSPGDSERAADAPPDFQPSLDSPYDLPDIPLRMGHFVFQESLLGRARVLVVADVDVRELEFREVEGRSVDSLEYIMVVAHRETGAHHRYDEKVELDLQPGTREALEESWYSIAKQFDLDAGEHQARIVVSDAASGRVGSVIHDFEVPPLGELRTSSPILTDQVQQGAARPRPVLRLPRRYSSDSVLYCEYEVYGAKTDGNGMPRVAAGYAIRSRDGAVLAHVGPTLIRPSSLGQLSRLVAAPLDGVPPGEYELVLSVSDELAGSEISVREPFEVVAADGGA
jgi:VWFA-related protein